MLSVEVVAAPQIFLFPAHFFYPPISSVCLFTNREFWEEVLPVCFPTHGWAVLHADIAGMATLSPVECTDI